MALWLVPSGTISQEPSAFCLCTAPAPFLVVIPVSLAKKPRSWRPELHLFCNVWGRGMLDVLRAFHTCRPWCSCVQLPRCSFPMPPRAPRTPTPPRPPRLRSSQAPPLPIALHLRQRLRHVGVPWPLSPSHPLLPPAGIIMWEMFTGQRPYLELLQSNRDKKIRDKLILSKVIWGLLVWAN